MAKVWGPMGWITLHSIGAAYPHSPSSIEKENAKKFLEYFTDTITCRYCKDHFLRIHMSYRSQYPEYLDNKTNFFLFTLRAHNEVNRSLDKPVIDSVSSCLESLKNATALNGPSSFKDSYTSYLIRTWAHDMTGDALIYKSKSISMRDLLIPINLKDPFNFEIEEADVTSFRLVFSKGPSNFTSFSNLNAKVGFNGGRLKLR